MVDSIGVRALAVSLAEMARGAGEAPPGSNAGPDIARYFAGCVRGGKPLGITSGPWCAAAACWAMCQALEPGEEPPHPWRPSGIELERDAGDRGLWYPAGLVAAECNSFAVGDLAIYRRGPGWGRHVVRVETIDRPRFTAIGGNEGDRWARTERSLFDADLLGFVVYGRVA